MIPMLDILNSYLGNVEPADLIILNFQSSESLELPVAWLMSSCLMLVWKDKLAGVRPRWELVRAELTAKLAVLKETRWNLYNLHNSAVIIDEMLNLH